MKTFLILFKHERRSLFPSLSLKKKPDIIGGILSLLVSALVIGIFLFMVSTIAKNYVAVRLNKVSDPIARSAELLTVLYIIIIAAVAVLCLEKMRNTLASKAGRDIFLRLPISSKTLFFSKLSALVLWNYVTAIFFILPINVIFYVILKPGMAFWINTALVAVFLPLVSFLISTLLLIPYIRVIGFLSRHYFITFIVLSGILMGAFFVYSELLDVIRTLLETGSIKFLFNEKFVSFLQKTQKFVYPANLLAYMVLGQKLKTSILVLCAVAAVSVVLALIITNGLYKITFFSTSREKIRRGRRHIMHLPPLFALMRKEFISVFRNPKHLFSYFSIALSMPFMIYCCYTLFETLLVNAIGRSFELALSLTVLLVFSILTNTFCATNISRDGKAALKAKIFPMKPSVIILSKILFCNIVSSLSVVLSGVFLYFKAEVSMKNALIASVIGLIFSIAQILIATRMDLNHARVASSEAETERASSKTIAKTITVGLFFAVLISFLSIFASAFAGSSLSFLKGITVEASYSYVIPFIVAGFYLVLSLVYCFVGVKKAFNKLVK